MINPGDKVTITGGERKGETGIATKPDYVDGIFGIYLVEFENGSTCWKSLNNLWKVKECVG